MKLLTVLQQCHSFQFELVNQNNGTHKAKAPGYLEKNKYGEEGIKIMKDCLCIVA